MRDTDDFRTPDSEDESSTDVSNPYRNIRWTEEPPLTTQTEADVEADPGEEGPTSASRTREHHIHLTHRTRSR